MSNQHTGRYLVIVEDDPRSMESILGALGEKFPNFRLIPIQTESDFLAALTKAEPGSWAGVILDMMLPWARPSPSMMRPPASVIREGIFRAGHRCRQAIRLRFPELPVIIYTALDLSSVDEGRCDPCTITLQKAVELNNLYDALQPIYNQLERTTSAN
jgi:hypothetical protein